MSNFPDVLTALASDPDNAEINLCLAQQYHAMGQTAAAVTYFTRAAERAESLELAYACLIMTAWCFDQQGHRHVTVRSMLKRAIALMPRRPEAYWYLAKFNEHFNQHSDCYVLCELAMAFCDQDLPPLPVDVGYPGSWIFRLERGISAWWWGLNDETRSDFQWLVDHEWHRMPKAYRDNLAANMVRIKQLDQYFALEYQRACDATSDINQHLPYLRELAMQCEHVTEMGVRHGASTRAWLSTPVVLRSYDIWIDPNVMKLFDLAQYIGKDVVLTQADVLQIHIDPTDLLFIDTQHQYHQLRAELARHADRSRRYIVLHDTATFGHHDDIGSGPGLQPAIQEFLRGNPLWSISYSTDLNNGLTVLRRRDS